MWERTILNLNYSFSIVATYLVVLQYGVLRSAIVFGPHFLNVLGYIHYM